MVKPKHIFRGSSRNHHDFKMWFVALKHFLPFCTSPPLKQAICNRVRIILLIISCAWKWCALMTSHTTRNSCATQSRIYVTSFFFSTKASAVSNTNDSSVNTSRGGKKRRPSGAEGGRIAWEICHSTELSSYATTIQALTICTKGRGK